VSRRPIAELVDDIDEVLGREWLTLPEVMERLTESWNNNPAVTGRGIFRLNGKESFSAYAHRCRSKLYTYQDVSSAMEAFKYPTRVGARWANGIGDVEVTVWGRRATA
jgi:hypothetical protein